MDTAIRVNFRVERMIHSSTRMYPQNERIAGAAARQKSAGPAATELKLLSVGVFPMISVGVLVLVITAVWVSSIALRRIYK